MEIFVLFYLSYFAAILIHEIGHAIAVLLVGHNLVEFSAGPFCIKRQKGKYHYSIRSGFFTGLVRYERDFTKTSQKSEMAIIGSGVIANFVAGTILFLIFTYFDANSFFAIFGSISLILGLLNLFPAKIKSLGIDNDARRFLDIIALSRGIKNTEYKDISIDKCTLILKDKSEVLESPSEIEFYNDDKTPMEYVVFVLKKCFQMDDYAAAALMMAIHTNGSAKIGWVDLASANKCVDFINRKAREVGFPFSCNVLVAESR